MSTYHTLDNFSASGKRVLVRVDLNVPMQGEIVTDTNRITKTLPTLKRLSAAGAKVIILSHFGRPKGEWNEDLSLNNAIVHRRVEDTLSVWIYDPTDGSISHGETPYLPFTKIYKGDLAN